MAVLTTNRIRLSAIVSEHVARGIEQALVLLDEVDDSFGGDGADCGPRAPPRSCEEEIAVVEWKRFVPYERYELEFDVSVELDFLRSLHDSEVGRIRRGAAGDDPQRCI